MTIVIKSVNVIVQNKFKFSPLMLLYTTAFESMTFEHKVLELNEISRKWNIKHRICKKSTDF